MAKELSKYTITVTKDTQISISWGNSKIGKMMNWSTLPGDKDHMLTANGELLTTIPGTCCGKCDACFKNCYAVNSAKLHHNVNITAWGKNTLMLRNYPEEVYKQLDAALTKKNKKWITSKKPEDIAIKFVRINVSGELETLEQLEMWDKLAKAHPECKFGIYSKCETILLAFFKKHGQTADNLTINISQWHGVMDDTLKQLRDMKAIVNVFEYDDSNRSWCNLSLDEKGRLAGESHCPAVLKSGKHANKPDGTPILCSDCGRCYRKTGETTAVYDH